MVFRQPGHHSRVAQECAVQIFNGPSRNAMIALRGNVSLDFLTALRSADRPPVISHDLRIRMHGHERFAMAIIPSVKSKARRFDHATLLRLTLSPGGCRNWAQISGLVAYWHL